MTVHQSALKDNRIQPPGPRGVISGLQSLAHFGKDPLDFFTSLAHTYGDIVSFPLGQAPTYLVAHPDYVHQLLVEDADRMYKTTILKRALEPSLGNGLLLNDGESWRRQRRLVQPAFHMKRIESYAGVMVDFARRIMAEWQPGQTREISHDMMKLTLGVVAKTLFDADVSDNADRIGEAITTGLEVTNKQFARLWQPPAWWPSRDRRRGEIARQTLDDVIMGFIKARRSSHEDKGDLLSMLLMAVDSEGSGGMTDKQARDEAFTLFAAGHETTAVTLTWTWYLLSQNPQVEARLHAELDRALGGRAPAMADLPNLPYTDMVIKEAMRLYPPAWTVARQTIADVSFDKFSIPPGRVIFASQWVSHRDPRYFTDPEVFRPERWVDNYEKTLPKGVYYPFGAGPRICIGNMFAQMEARLVLATIAARYSLQLPPGQVVATQPLITLRPRYGMRMVVQPRIAPRISANRCE